MNNFKPEEQGAKQGLPLPTVSRRTVRAMAKTAKEPPHLAEQSKTPQKSSDRLEQKEKGHFQVQSKCVRQWIQPRCPAPCHHPPAAHAWYLQVLPIIVVDHSQKDGHEDVGIDDDVGYEVQRIPPIEVIGRHPRRKESRGMVFHSLGPQRTKGLPRALSTYTWCSKSFSLSHCPPDGVVLCHETAEPSPP